MNFAGHQVHSQNSGELSETPISDANPETYRLSTGGPLSAHLKFLESKYSLFDATAHIVLGTRAIGDAFAPIESEIAEGASRVCAKGCPGMGKTSLARALPKLLGDKARIALVPVPALWGNPRERPSPDNRAPNPAAATAPPSAKPRPNAPSWSRSCPSHDSASNLKATLLTKVTNFPSGGSIESKHSNLNSPRFRETAFRPTPTSISSARDAERRNASAPMRL